MFRHWKSQLFLIIIVSIMTENSANSNCDWKYYQHYEQKGCSPVSDKDGCPLKFQCKNITEEDKKKCYHGGSIFNQNQKIKSSDPCLNCECTSMWPMEDAHFDCSQSSCPYRIAEEPLCYLAYEPNSCCPEVVCKKPGSNFVCIYKDKSYHIGQVIETENPCRICLCNKQWNGPDGPGCRRVECLLGIYAKQIRSGCLPIYPEEGCCPFEMYCGGIRTVSMENKGDIQAVPAKDKDNFCHYNKKYFPVGTEAVIESEWPKCVKCVCNTPPDFTCVQQEKCS